MMYHLCFSERQNQSSKVGIPELNPVVRAVLTIFKLCAGSLSLQKINNRAAGIQTPLTLKGQGGLDTCCTIIDFLQIGNQHLIQKWSIQFAIIELSHFKTNKRTFKPS